MRFHGRRALIGPIDVIGPRAVRLADDFHRALAYGRESTDMVIFTYAMVIFTCVTVIFTLKIYLRTFSLRTRFSSFFFLCLLYRQYSIGVYVLINDTVYRVCIWICLLFVRQRES